MKTLHESHSDRLQGQAGMLPIILAIIISLTTACMEKPLHKAMNLPVSIRHQGGPGPTNPCYARAGDTHDST